MTCIHSIKVILIQTLRSVCFYHGCFYRLLINEMLTSEVFPWLPFIKECLKECLNNFHRRMLI